MVFADLVGFTSLNESADPELVQALVTRAFDRLSAEVARYEGTVEKFAGDAMLAVFGVPVVHEDDAERAVRAALEMQAAMGELAAELRREGRPELSLRIGIETGEVLVDQGRASGERDRIVTGDAVNTAARLQQVAPPGAIVVGPFTYAATRDVVEYEELPAAVLKGKALPVAAWRAVAVKARRGGVRPSLGIEAPLIGREEEIALIKETVRRTVSERRPHLVTVIGSAGVGKSRLTWELEKYLDGLPETFYWRKGRCLAYAQARFSALADAVKADARILDDDAPATAQAKLEARMAELGCGGRRVDRPRRWPRCWPSAPTRASAATSCSTPGAATWSCSPPAARWSSCRRTSTGPTTGCSTSSSTWRAGRRGRSSSSASPDTSSSSVARPGAAASPTPRPSCWSRSTPTESAQLVDALLAGGLPPELRDRVVTLADGNPLFTEELVRMFVDRGVLRFVDGRWQLARPVEEVEIPGSIQAVLAARLDGLPAAEKRAAQNASVVGRIFWDALIAHLARQGASATGELLRRLRVKELVVPRPPSALAGAAEFGFRHVLIRDVAYDSLPKRDRAAKHLDVARWAEETLADRQDEMVELLAAHYLAALRYEEEFAAADSERLRELRTKTYAYARRAAARADAVANKESAARWYGVAVEQARALDLPGRERAALAIEYDDAAAGHEPHETIRRDRRGGAGARERSRRPRTPESRPCRSRHPRRRSPSTGTSANDLAGARAVLADGLASAGGRSADRGSARRCARGSVGPTGGPGRWRRRRPSFVWPSRTPRPAVPTTWSGWPCTTWPSRWACSATRPSRWRSSSGAWSSPGRLTTACCWGAATSTCRRSCSATASSRRTSCRSWPRGSSARGAASTIRRPRGSSRTAPTCWPSSVGFRRRSRTPRRRSPKRGSSASPGASRVAWGSEPGSASTSAIEQGAIADVAEGRTVEGPGRTAGGHLRSHDGRA